MAQADLKIAPVAGAVCDGAHRGMFAGGVWASAEELGIARLLGVRVPIKTPIPSCEGPGIALSDRLSSSRAAAHPPISIFHHSMDVVRPD